MNSETKVYMKNLYKPCIINLSMPEVRMTKFANPNPLDRFSPE
jgi:hypothetical protein